MKHFGANRWLALIIGALSVLYLVAAYQIQTFPIPRPVDSDAIPKVLGYLMLGLSVWLFFVRDQVSGQEQAQSAPQGTEASVWTRPWMQVAVTAAVIVAYAFLLEPLGFLLASVLLVGGLSWYYGYRRHLVNAIVSISVPLLLYLVLTRAMTVHLPRGLIPI